jgi:hypothetical protein
MKDLHWATGAHRNAMYRNAIYRNAMYRNAMCQNAVYRNAMYRNAMCCASEESGRWSVRKKCRHREHPRLFDPVGHPPIVAPPPPPEAQPACQVPKTKEATQPLHANNPHLDR